MVNAVKEYCDAVQEINEYYTAIAYLKNRHDKVSLEYEVLALAEEKSKLLEGKIKRLKREYSFKY
jgi:hypothetical protein